MSLIKMNCASHFRESKILLSKITNILLTILAGTAFMSLAGVAHSAPKKGDKIVFHTSNCSNNQVRVYTDGGGDSLINYWTECGEHNLTPSQLRMVARNSNNDENSSCEDLGLNQQFYETGKAKWSPAAGEAIFSLNCRTPGALLRHYSYCVVFGLCAKQ
jgi:hypothetical protein